MVKYVIVVDAFTVAIFNRDGKAHPVCGDNIKISSANDHIINSFISPHINTVSFDDESPIIMSRLLTQTRDEVYGNICLPNCRSHEFHISKLSSQILWSYVPNLSSFDQWLDITLSSN